jgi:hypothetical protein
VLVALRKQVQAGQRVTVLARVEDQARRFRVRPAKEPSAASMDPLTLLIHLTGQPDVAAHFRSAFSLATTLQPPRPSKGA